MATLPCALSIAGLDPSGGAGLFADLRAFAAAKVWGCGATAVITIQSTAGLRRSEPVAPQVLLAQIRELVRHQNVRAVKIGALGSAANARAVARWLQSTKNVPVVLDPVMHGTRAARGAALLASSALPELLSLVRLSTIVTPNVPEAELLLARRIRSLADAEHAARDLVRLGARAALVKGGHLPRSSGTVVDVLAVGSRVIRLSGSRSAAEVHGTGCMLSSLAAGHLARAGSSRDDAIVEAARWAKRTLSRALAHPLRIGDGLQVSSP
jgi:hydroxymethylpyrimidine/phosphomethylpyrimidine kinase